MFNFVIAAYVFAGIFAFTLMVAGWGWIVAIVFRHVKNTLEKNSPFTSDTNDNIAFLLCVPFALGLPMAAIAGVATGNLP